MQHEGHAAPALVGPSGFTHSASSAATSAPTFIPVAPPMSPFEQLNLQQAFEPRDPHGRLNPAPHPAQVSTNSGHLLVIWNGIFGCPTAGTWADILMYLQIFSVHGSVMPAAELLVSWLTSVASFSIHLSIAWATSMKGKALVHKIWLLLNHFMAHAACRPLLLPEKISLPACWCRGSVWAHQHSMNLPARHRQGMALSSTTAYLLNHMQTPRGCRPTDTAFLLRLPHGLPCSC